MKLRSKILGINIIALAFVLTAVIYITAPLIVNSRGQSSLWLFTGAVLGVGVVSIVLSAFLLESMVIRRISGLTKRVNHIKDYRSYYESLHYAGKDEVAILANAINQMLRRIVSSTNEVGALNAQLQEEKDNVEARVSHRTEQLSTEQARLKASIGNLSLGFIMTDMQRNILLINRQARQILRSKLDGGDAFDGEDAAGAWTLAEVDHRLGERFGLIEKLGRCLRSGESEDFTNVEYNDRILRILVSPILESKQKATLGCVILLEDVTERAPVARSHNEPSAERHTN